jgi:hypothetical protein
MKYSHASGGVFDTVDGVLSPYVDLVSNISGAPFVIEQ